GNPQDYALTVERGQGRDPQVDLTAQHAELDTAVLGQAALGDVELGHELDARDQRCLKIAGRRVNVVQDAIDAIAHPQLFLKWLDVDVRGALFQSPSDPGIDQAEDRRLAG